VWIFLNILFLRWGVVRDSSNPPSWRTTPRRLSVNVYSMYSQLPSISEDVPPSATWGPAMPWWQGPTNTDDDDDNNNNNNNNNNKRKCKCQHKQLFPYLQKRELKCKSALLFSLCVLRGSLDKRGCSVRYLLPYILPLHSSLNITLLLSLDSRFYQLYTPACYTKEGLLMNNVV
jgi:hypothetical protein